MPPHPVLITDPTRCANACRSIAARVICVDDGPAWAPVVAARPPELTRPDNLAYVIYTSGIDRYTQRRGMVVASRGRRTTVAWLQSARHAHRDDTRSCRKRSLSFDASLTELHVATPHGRARWSCRRRARIPILPRVIRCMTDHDVSVLRLVPSLLAGARRGPSLCRLPDAARGDLRGRGVAAGIVAAICGGAT